MCRTCGKILNAQTGVVAASVNLAASTAAVEYDTMQTSPERLRQAVQEGGYDMLADSDDDTPDELERMNRERYRDLKRRAFWAVVLAIPVVVIGMFFMDMPYGGAIMALLSAPVVFWLGRGFFVNAWQQLRHRTATMDTLVALSTGIAYLFSLFNLVFPEFWLSRGVEPHVYFEAAAVIVAFILLGRTLEEKAKGDTTASLKKLIGLQPKMRSSSLRTVRRRRFRSAASGSAISWPFGPGRRSPWTVRFAKAIPMSMKAC